MNKPSYHGVARWLVEILSLIRAKINMFGLKASFELISCLEDPELSQKFMCSVDVQSLFTNIPLHETVDYICELVESRKLSIPIPTELLKDTILLRTQKGQFYLSQQSL